MTDSLPIRVLLIEDGGELRRVLAGEPGHDRLGRQGFEVDAVVAEGDGVHLPQPADPLMRPAPGHLVGHVIGSQGETLGHRGAQAVGLGEIELVPLGQGDLPIRELVAMAPRVDAVIVELDYCNVEMFQAIEESYRFMTGNALAAGNK